MKTVAKKGSDGKANGFRKGDRIVRRFMRIDRDGWLTITIVRRSGTEVTDYKVEETGSNVGRSFRLWKFEDGASTTSGEYTTTVGGGGYGHCTCEGFKRSCGCKHIAAVRVLCEMGKLNGIKGIPG